MIELLLHNYFLLALLALSAVLAGVLAFYGAYKFNFMLFQGKLNKGYNRLRDAYNNQRIAEEVKKYTRTIHIKLSLLEKLEIRYVDKPNLRRWLPFMNLNIIMAVSLILSVVTFGLVYSKLYHIPSSLSLAAIIFCVPFVGLDMLSKYNSERVRKKLATFVAILNKWCDVKEDIIYIFENSIESVGQPLASFITDCIIQMKSGLNEYEALDIFSMKVDSEQFQDFVLNLKQNRKHRGKLKELLTNLEDEFFNLEEEYDRRKITTFGSRLRVYGLMVFVAAVGYFFMQFNSDVKHFYLQDEAGKLLMTVFFIIYFIAFIISTKITSFNY
ncbi:MAG: hypothetical protein M1308_01700 [Actinobacteria bacterium]|nr:hypothetical protein [Actinomycetota bacterium]